MKQVLATVLLTITMIGCTSTEVVEPEPNHDHYGYFPVTVGTSWEYKVIRQGDTTDLIRKIDGDTLLNGKHYGKYYGFNGTQVFKKALYRRSNDTLYTLRTSKLTEWTQLIEKQGIAWAVLNSNGEPSGTDTLRIVAKGISRTVLGKTYNDVLHSELTSTAFGTQQIREDSYFAKGIGLIENYSSYDTMLLVNYTKDV